MLQLQKNILALVLHKLQIWEKSHNCKWGIFNQANIPSTKPLVFKMVKPSLFLRMDKNKLPCCWSMNVTSFFIFCASSLTLPFIDLLLFRHQYLSKPSLIFPLFPTTRPVIDQLWPVQLSVYALTPGLQTHFCFGVH